MVTVVVVTGPSIMVCVVVSVMVDLAKVGFVAVVSRRVDTKKINESIKFIIEMVFGDENITLFFEVCVGFCFHL